MISRPTIYSLKPLHVPVEHGDADLNFRDLAIEVPRHERLAEQFHTMHPALDAAPAVVSGQSSPQRRARISRRAHRFGL